MTPSTSRPSFPSDYDVTQLGRNVHERPVGRPLVVAWSAMIILVGLVVLAYFLINVLGYRS